VVAIINPDSINPWLEYTHNSFDQIYKTMGKTTMCPKTAKRKKHVSKTTKNTYEPPMCVVHINKKWGESHKDITYTQHLEGCNKKHKQ